MCARVCSRAWQCRNLYRELRSTGGSCVSCAGPETSRGERMEGGEEREWLVAALPAAAHRDDGLQVGSAAIYSLRIVLSREKLPGTFQTTWSHPRKKGYKKTNFFFGCRLGGFYKSVQIVNATNAKYKRDLHSSSTGAVAWEENTLSLKLLLLSSSSHFSLHTEAGKTQVEETVGQKKTQTCKCFIELRRCGGCSTVL